MKRCVISLFVALVGLLVVLGPSLLATAGDDGSFAAEWSIDIGETGSNEYLITAKGVLTTSATGAGFGRITTVQTDKFDYMAGDMQDDNAINPLLCSASSSLSMRGL